MAKIILTRPELIQLAKTMSTTARELDNSEWGICSSTSDDYVVERFLQHVPEFKQLVENDTFILEVNSKKAIAILKIIDTNVGDLTRVGKGIWLMLQGFGGSLKRIGREIEAIATRK